METSWGMLLRGTGYVLYLVVISDDIFHIGG